MKKRTFLSVAFLLTTSIFFGQAPNIEATLPDIIPPSPTVANLMQFEEVPISHYTGQPNISLPIFDKEISAGLRMGISLDYNTQGVKVDNRSGWVGTGWTLTAGGSISRTVRDVPDETVKGQANNKTGILHLPSYESLPEDQKTEYNWKVIGSSVDKYDKEPDLYQFNFLGYSGRFIVTRGGGDSLEAQLITKNHDFDIDISNDTDYTINGFTVTDPYGYKYTFDVIEISTSTSVNAFVFDSLSETGIINSQDVFTANSAWHLSSIRSSNGIELLALNYGQLSTEEYTVSVNRSRNEIISIIGNKGQILSNTYNQGVLRRTRGLNFYYTTIGTRKVSEVIFKDGVRILFEPSDVLDHPETGGEVLENIIVLNGTDEQKRYVLSHHVTSESTNTPYPHVPDTNGSQTSRLWLDKVTEQTDSDSLEYTLGYNDEEDLPGFDSSRSGPWGYYSGINTAGNAFNQQLITTGLLSSITYPTGGVKEFIFEHNEYSHIGDREIDIEEATGNPNNTTPVDHSFPFSYENTADTAIMDHIIGTIDIPFEQSIQITPNATISNNSGSLDDYTLFIIDQAGNHERLFLIDGPSTVSNVPEGTYDIGLRNKEVAIIDIDPPYYVISGAIDMVTQELGLTDDTGQEIEIKQTLLGGGVRIKEVLFKDDRNGAGPSKRLTYSYDDQGDPDLSSGVIDSKGGELQKEYTLYSQKFLFTSHENTYFAGNEIEYLITEKGADAQLTQGSYVGYRNVKVREEGNGYEIYTFTSPKEYPLDSSVFNYPYERPIGNIDYKRGLLLKRQVYDEQGRVLKEVSNLGPDGTPNYEFDEELVYRAHNPYKNEMCPWFQFFDLYGFFANGTSQNVPGLPFYALYRQ